MNRRASRPGSRPSRATSLLRVTGERAGEKGVKLDPPPDCEPKGGEPLLEKLGARSRLGGATSVSKPLRSFCADSWASRAGESPPLTVVIKCKRSVLRLCLSRPLQKIPTYRSDHPCHHHRSFRHPVRQRKRAR